MWANQTPAGSKDSTVFYPYEMNYITEELRKRAKAELFEDEDTIVHSLKLLKSMLTEEKILNWQDNDAFLLAFLRARKYDVKRTLKLVKCFNATRSKHRELYENFNYEDVRRTIAENTIGVLHSRDSEGCVILYIRTEPWNPQMNSLGDVMRALTCGLLHGILSPATQIAGFKVIVDFSGCGMEKLPYITPTYLWLFAEALQNCFPARFKAIHMINEGQVIYYVWSVLKIFLSRKLRERFHFHGKNGKKLHKYFSPSILPAEFGGELPPTDNRKWAESMEKSAPYFTEILSYSYKKKHGKSLEKRFATQ